MHSYILQLCSAIMLRDKIAGVTSVLGLLSAAVCKMTPLKKSRPFFYKKLSYLRGTARRAMFVLCFTRYGS